MRFGLDVAQQQLTWEELVQRVEFAEEAGFDGLWLFDHFKALYGDPTGPAFEAWTTMAALAAMTERIRLGTLVTGITYRHPSILATEAVTIDHISHGRVEVAVGAAWFEPEHRELGIPFPPVRERAERLEEAIVVMRLLMTQDEASFDGRYYQLENATYRPRPVQQPHPPIWVGASGERLMLPIVARQADMWHDSGSTDELIRKSRLIDRLAEEAGRDPATIGRAFGLSLSQPWDDVRRTVETLSKEGFSYATVGWPSEGLSRLQEFVETVLPQVAAA